MGWPFAVALAVRGVGEMLASGFAALRVRLCGGTLAVLDDEAVTAREAGEILLASLDVRETDNLVVEQSVLDG